MAVQMLRKRHERFSPRSMPPGSLTELPPIALVAGFRKLTG
jgi:hypothetical protein